MGFEESVHIIPLGYEIDRVVKPFEEYKPNRVYLLVTPAYSNCPKEMNDRQEYFTTKVKKDIEERGIEVQTIDVDLFDILQVMKSVADLILREKSKGNRVFVNMSGAGRLTSVGATLAAMAHNATVYYVEADRYSRGEEEEDQHGLSICGKPKIKFLKNFRIKLPDGMSKAVLTSLCKEGKAMGTDQITDILIAKGIAPELFKEYKKLPKKEEQRRQQQRNLINLNKTIIAKLKKSGYVKTKKVGKYTRIKITESGKYVAHIIGQWSKDYKS